MVIKHGGFEMNDLDISKTMFETIRNVSGRYETKKRVFEAIEREVENNGDGPIAITNDSKFGTNVLRTQIASFKQSVNTGAKFSSENSSEPENNPLVYYPNTGNLIFSGMIPSLSGLKFQFSLNDVTNGPYIFVEGLSLTEEVITTLNKMRGFYLNWKEEWQMAGDMLDGLKK